MGIRKKSLKHFLEFLREVLKGMVHAISAYLFRIHALENKKTTLGRHASQRVVRTKNNILVYYAFTLAISSATAIVSSSAVLGTNDFKIALTIGPIAPPAVISNEPIIFVV